MAVKYVTIKCPECGANLPIEEGRQAIFCSYCGSQVMLVDENEYKYKYEVTHHHVDEAKIMRAETDRCRTEADKEYRLKLLELEEKEDRRSGIVRAVIYGASLIMVMFSIIYMVADKGLYSMSIGMIGILVALLMFVSATNMTMSANKRKRERIAIRSGKIKLTDEALEYRGIDYNTVRSIYKDLGFNNIKTVSSDDLIFGLLRKPGQVYSITVNKSSPSRDTWYDPNAKVTIRYHGFSD